MRRQLAVLLILIVVTSVPAADASVSADGNRCCFGADDAPGASAGAGAVGGAGSSVSSWVIDIPGSGPPSDNGGGGGGASAAIVCTSWRPAAELSGDASPVDAATFRTDSDGAISILHFRDCGDPPTRQFVWVRQETPISLATAAMRDLQSRLLRPPVMVLSPPDRAVVNLETWLAAVDDGPVSVTAAVPGLASTATASIVSTAFDLGNGDSVVCEGAGRPWTVADGDGPAPCGYVFRQANAPGSTSRIRATFTWEITWQSTTGVGGSLPSVTSDAAVVDLPVVEIQTIGVGR